jgi:hypothetical protein
MIAIETDRLTIRNFGSDDWQDLQEVAVQYRASEWAKYEDPWPTSTEEVKGMAEWFAQAAMEYVFGPLAAEGILTGTHPANEPSVRLLEKLGLTEIDRGEFAISREEWLALGQAST